MKRIPNFKSIRILSLALVLSLLAAAVPVFAQTALERVDAACAVFPTYEAGTNSALLSGMEYAVLKLPAGSPEMKLAEQKLLAAFPTATLDGQRTIGRILYPIATEETVRELTPLRTSGAHDGETARIVRMLLRVIEEDRPVTYPKNSAFLAPYQTEERFRPDFRPETDAELQRRLESETAAVLACADPRKRLELLEKMGASIERTAEPLAAWQKLLASPDVVTRKQVWDLMGRTSRSMEVLEFAASQMQESPETTVNAALAAVRLTNVKRYAQADRCRQILRDVYENCASADVRNRAKAVLLQMDLAKGRIFEWLATQPLPESETPVRTELSEDAWLPLLTGRVKLGWELATARDFPKGSALYLRSFVSQDADRMLTAQLEFAGPVQVWLNGKLIFERTEAASATTSAVTAEFPAAFVSGWNELCVQTVSPGGACVFSMRFCEKDGFVAEGLNFQTEKKP